MCVGRATCGALVADAEVIAARVDRDGPACNFSIWSRIVFPMSWGFQVILPNVIIPWLRFSRKLTIVVGILQCNLCTNIVIILGSS